MGELINGRTPEEIKIGILCSNGCCDCPYAGFINEDETCSEYVEKDTIALIERLEAERDAALAKVPKRISVEERLPEKLNENNQAYLTEEVIGFDDEECAYIGQFMVYKHDGHYTFFDGHHFRDDITHWMPTPEPPEEE